MFAETIPLPISIRLDQGRQTRQNLRREGDAEKAKIDATIPIAGPIFKRVHFVAFLRKAIKKGPFLR